MDNREQLKEELNKRVEEFRFFALKDNQQESGDRFLMPWIYLHIFGTSNHTRSTIKRAVKEINSFFNQEELVGIQKVADDLWVELLEEQLLDSAIVYLRISKSDPNFARKFFGLVRMTEEEADNKIFRDVYGSMITLLIRLPDYPYRTLMIRALDESFLTVYPEQQGRVDQWLESLPDPAMRELFRR